MVAPTGLRSPRELIAVLPRIADQRGGVRARLAQLDAVDGWETDVARLAGPRHVDEIPDRLSQIVDAVVALYPQYAHGNPTMLIHAATAPNAVARTLPLLPRELWADSLASAWSASAAVVSAYAPVEPAAAPAEPVSVDHALEQALAHGGEHVIKFTDAALTTYERTNDPAALSAIMTAIELDA